MNAPAHDPGSVSAGLVGSRWWVTRHALARWMERYATTLTPGAAARQLAELSHTALDTGSEARNGKPVYLHPDWPGARFIIAREPRPRLDVLVTILDQGFVEARLNRRHKPRS